MKLSCSDKNFITHFLNVENHAPIENVCHAYTDASNLVLRCSEKLKALLSPEQLNIYSRELANREEAEEILKKYYFSVGLKAYSHIVEITDNPSAFIDALYSENM